MKIKGSENDRCTWSPAFDAPAEKTNVFTILARIAHDLTDISEREFFSLGLLRGIEGVALFFLYYGKLTNDEKYVKQGVSLFYKIIQTSEHESYSFAEGYPGLGWFFEHVHAHGFVKEDPERILMQTDRTLYHPMLDMVAAGNLDALDGALGIGKYFLSRNSGHPVTVLKTLIKTLEKTAIKENDGSIFWRNSNQKEVTGTVPDLGLARGMAGMLAFLVRVHKKNNEPATRVLMEGCASYILKHRQDSGRHTRLAWCTGDLGIGYALRQASEGIGDTIYKEKSLAILGQAAQRMNSETEGVGDACLCHGTAGIAHIFLRLYNRTGQDTFRQAAAFWFNETLKRSTFTDGIGGYKRYNPNLKKFTNEQGLLEGAAGIGLALITSVAEFPPEWDDCYLV